MPHVAISEDIYNRALAFKPVVEAVLNIELQEQGFIELLLRLCPDLLLNEFLGGANSAGLLRLLQQLGQAEPQIYGVMAHVMAQNELKTMEEAQRSEMKRTLGFPEPARGDGYESAQRIPLDEQVDEASDNQSDSPG